MIATTTFVPNPDFAREVQRSEDLQKAVDEAAAKVADAAKAIAPVDTGALQASIHVVTGKDGEAEVIADVPYAVFVEFGTINDTAQPFLRPAADSVIGLGG